MEKMSFLFLLIIIIYLFVSFITRKKTTENKKIDLIKKDKDEEKTIAAIVAAISFSLENIPHIVKRVYMVGEVNEKKSSWKFASRNENMMKRNFFK